jgi:hypothetical protein
MRYRSSQIKIKIKDMSGARGFGGMKETTK